MDTGSIYRRARCALLLSLAPLACAKSQPGVPRPESIVPSSTITGQSVVVQILGKSFSPQVISNYDDPALSNVETPFKAFLGGVSLEEVRFVSTTELGARVPAMLPTGVFDLTVVDPRGHQGVLPDAFTVRSATDGGVLDLGPPEKCLVNPAVPGSCCGPADCKDAKAPVCDAKLRRCRACAAHLECPTGLCTASGACPPEAEVSYVSGACDPAAETGSKAQPYCKIAGAVGQARKLIRVAAGVYGDIVIDHSHELYGQSGAVIQPSACDRAEIKGAGVSVLLSGFAIYGNLSVSGTATATLVGNRIGPSTCIGVKVESGSTLIARRNVISFHNDGGIKINDAAYELTNNFIIQNGGATSVFGGVELKPKGTPAVFMNNTVAGNTSKGTTKDEAGGVRCDLAATLVNSILWGNTPTAQTEQQAGALCAPTSCDLELKSGTPPPGNLALNPLFVGGGTDEKAYHLSTQSPLKGKATPQGAPAIDFDGDPRGSPPDIGADEIP